MLAAAVAGLAGTSAPVHAAPAEPSPAGSVQSMCGAAEPGDFTCFALRRTDVKAVKGLRGAVAAPSGLSPADLQSAYKLPSDGGEGQTIAIVDAFDDPQAEADLALYRQQYGLPACTTADGCFTKVDQRGGSGYPAPDAGWSGEISLDLDMISAAAPKARILLVEADSAYPLDLAAGVDEAVALGAKFVSNSWGSNYQLAPEDPAETALDSHFDHPGVAIVASSGDSDYGVSYPAASPYVTSAGGTSLVPDSGTARGWSESVWNSGAGKGTGSGCSLYEPKPSFQTDSGCAGRTVADVSAVADPATGLAVYDSSGGGWIVIGGTSASAPIITATYADAGTPVAGTRPNEYPYLASSSALNDVTGGNNGACAGSASYLCTAGTGYDGPTGLGTPNGLDAFRLGAHGELSGTVTDRSGKPVSGAVLHSGPYSVMTDARGAYTLAMKAGTYTFTIDAYGYAEASVSASVSDGAGTHLDARLKQLAVEKVSGTVRDGAGHGWPLYAKVTVKGVPGGPVWTDPQTGAYTLRLPEKHTYTLQITSTEPGYLPATRDVVVTTGSSRADFALQGDTWAGTNPGYTLSVKTASTEPFDSTDSAAQAWSVVNAPGTTQGWVFDDPGHRGNHTGGTGGFAIADSNYANTRLPEDTQLISPVYDLSGDVSPELTFDTDYRGSSTQTGDVDISRDGGKTWTNLWHQTFQWLLGPSDVEIPLTAYARQPDIRVRFHYTGPGLYWALDNVSVADRVLSPVPGGLITGTVDDANTHQGVIGATVTDVDSSVQAVTVATPDDPAIGDGFYAAFEPGSGKQHFTGAMPTYTSSARSTRITANKTVRQNFFLKAGRLAVVPGSVSADVQAGHRVTERLTVKNTGDEPASWTAIERSGTEPGSPSAGTPADAWQSIANLPVQVYDNAVDTVQGTVYSAFGTSPAAGRLSSLYAYGPKTDSWSQRASAPQAGAEPAHGVIDGKIYYAGGWGSSGQPVAATQVYDPAADTWTPAADEPKGYGGAASAVLDGRLYSVGGCTNTCGRTDVQVYDPATNAWSAAAAYPEPISWGACGAIDGKLYCAGGVTSSSAPVADAYVYNPASNSWSRIADLPVILAQSSYTAANGELLLSGGITDVNGNFLATAHGYAYDPQKGTWNALPDSPTATTRGGGGSGMYRVGGTTRLPNAVSTAQVLRGYDETESDVGWLSASPGKVTLNPGQKATVTITLDATGLSRPGAYTATLEQASNTPYALAPVPVTLKVSGSTAH
ncbi:carboxypeptidase regulatory-like domain-containing protein [Streptomyces sp. NPDC087270]|uniref:carboxypeptidase regulatory-like domain-containing protein n=1 Tax=Streptomyces sp. NPDC087270 TaxID=3365774 RepID=UPI00380C102A